MIRYKGGRPSSTSLVEDEIIYYFCKLAPNRYSLGKCAQVFKISRTSIHSKVHDIDWKCKRDEEYLQHIKDTYSSFSNISEALSHFSDIQPVNGEDSFADKDNVATLEDILKMNINVRDIAFNFVEISALLKSMNDMLKKNNILLNNNPNNIDNQDNISI